MNNNTIAKIEPQDLANFDPDRDIKFAQKAAKALMVVIDATKPLILGGKKYLYFEHLQTIAKFFHDAPGVEWTKEIMSDSVPAHIIGYEARGVLYDVKGTIVGSAEAMCTKNERNWATKDLFTLKSMAQTRAMAKALRSKYGFVAILAGAEGTPAEEMVNVQVEEKFPTARQQIKAINQERERELTTLKAEIIALTKKIEDVPNGKSHWYEAIKRLTSLDLADERVENLNEIINRLKVRGKE